jgi:predicted heme/steroid binding protein
MKSKKLVWIIGLVMVLGLGLTSCQTVGTQKFTLAELATYDGKNGNKAYIAVNGKVYDVTNVEAWNSGSHQGASAGLDLTQTLEMAPHRKSVLDNLKIVGTLTN